jgi:hypothetical protein
MCLGKPSTTLMARQALKSFAGIDRHSIPIFPRRQWAKKKKTFYGIRPFRIITGSEDNTVAFYEGPPFKFKGLRSVRLLKFLMNLLRLVTIFQTSLAEKLFTELSLGNQQIRV